jgi:AsmA protein
VAGAFSVVLPETQDPAVFGKAKLSLALHHEPDVLDISSLVLQLDDTTIKGKMDVRNFSKPAIRFSLQLDDINADRYLPPPLPEGASSASSSNSASNATVTPVAGKGGAEAELLPVEMLRDLDVNGDLKIGKLKAYNLSSQQIEVGLLARQGKIRVHPASARLYEGAYEGDIGVDVSGRTPRISMNEKLTGVQAEPLFLDVADLKWVSGQADMSAKLTTTGNTMSALRKGLNGEVEFSFLNGAIKGFNLMHAIRSANALIQGFPAPPEEVQQTDFAELRGHANVRDGVVHNDLLVASSPLFKVTGKGSADLVREQLDYRVTTEITAALEGEAGRQLEKIKGTPLPVKISGSFYDPSIKVDLEDILKEKLKKKVEEKIEKKIQEKLDDKLKDQLGDKLKGLFGR